MGGSHLLSLYNSTWASRTKRLTAACLHPFRRYGEAGSSNEQQKLGGVVVKERAASTAEEFERVLKVKEKERQGVASQTSEKVHDGAKEAECMTDSVKEKYEKPLGKGNFHNTADDG